MTMLAPDGTRKISSRGELGRTSLEKEKIRKDGAEEKKIQRDAGAKFSQHVEGCGNGAGGGFRARCYKRLATLSLEARAYAQAF